MDIASSVGQRPDGQGELTAQGKKSLRGELARDAAGAADDSLITRASRHCVLRYTRLLVGAYEAPMGWSEEWATHPS